jgi:hypothetical protein
MDIGASGTIIDSTLLKKETWQPQKKKSRWMKDQEQVTRMLRARKGGFFRGKFKPPDFQEPKFQGKCDSLKRFIYDFSNGRQYNRYNLAMKDITEYVG